MHILFWKRQEKIILFETRFMASFPDHYHHPKKKHNVYEQSTYNRIYICLVSIWSSHTHIHQDIEQERMNEIWNKRIKKMCLFDASRFFSFLDNLHHHHRIFFLKKISKKSLNTCLRAYTNSNNHICMNFEWNLHFRLINTIYQMFSM